MQHRILSKVSSGFPHIFFVRQPGLLVLNLIHIVLHVSCVMTGLVKLKINLNQLKIHYLYQKQNHLNLFLLLLKMYVEYIRNVKS